MSALFASGHIADLLLLVMAVEAMALTWWRGRQARPLLVAILPGIPLMLALRAALVGAGWWWVAAALAAAGMLHVLDLRQRAE